MNKKLISLTIAIPLLSLFSVSVLSAPTANLKTSGNIKPPACTVNGKNQSDVIFKAKTISPELIPESKEYGLNISSNKIIVNCDADTYLTFKATNVYDIDFYPTLFKPTRKATIFPLVDSSNTQKVIGGVAFNIKTPTVDGNPVGFSRANDGDDPTASWGGELRILKGATMGWTNDSKNNIAPSDMNLVAGKHFSATIIADNGSTDDIPNSYILSKNQLKTIDVNLSSGLDFIGEAILTFNFGI